MKIDDQPRNLTKKITVEQFDVVKIHNNWNSHFFDNCDDVMKQNEKITF